jgi:hypothetical protein
MANNQHGNSRREAVSRPPNATHPFGHALYHGVIDIESGVKRIDHRDGWLKSVFGVANTEDILHVGDLFVDEVVVWSVN